MIKLFVKHDFSRERESYIVIFATTIPAAFIVLGLSTVLAIVLFKYQVYINIVCTPIVIKNY